jgi:hypothetical protein
MIGMKGSPLHTVEVTGSNPVTPTKNTVGRDIVGAFLLVISLLVVYSSI